MHPWIGQSNCLVFCIRLSGTIFMEKGVFLPSTKLGFSGLGSKWTWNELQFLQEYVHGKEDHRQGPTNSPTPSVVVLMILHKLRTVSKSSRWQVSKKNTQWTFHNWKASQDWINVGMLSGNGKCTILVPPAGHIQIHLLILLVNKTFRRGFVLHSIETNLLVSGGSWYFAIFLSRSMGKWWNHKECSFPFSLFFNYSGEHGNIFFHDIQTLLESHRTRIHFNWRR